jgi:hypothetical protein
MHGATITLIFVTLLYVTNIAAMRLITGRTETLREPATWFYLSWIFGLILLALPLFSYYETIELGTLFYITCLMFSFTSGTIAISIWQKTWAQKHKAVTTSPNENQNKIIKIFLIIGISGTTALILNAIASGSLSVSERFDLSNAAAVRADHMQEHANKIGPLYGPANFASSVGALGLIYIYYLIGRREKTVTKLLRVLAYVLLFINIIGATFAFGSRMFAVFSLMMAWFGHLHGRWSVGDKIISFKFETKKYLGWFIGISVILGFVWVSSTYFLESRVAGQDAGSLLFRTHRANFSDEAWGVIKNDKSMQYMLFTASYATTPVATLSYYLELPDSRQPGPFYGEYNFPPLGRWIRRLTFTGDPESWDKARYEIFKPLIDINFGGNVWATFPRDLIADFGKIGALIFLFMMGALSQGLHNSQNMSPSHTKVAVLVYLRIIFLFGGYVSILYLPAIHWPLYVSIVLLLLPKRKSRKVAKNNFRPVIQDIARQGKPA